MFTPAITIVFDVVFVILMYSVPLLEEQCVGYEVLSDYNSRAITRDYATMNNYSTFTKEMDGKMLLTFPVVIKVL